MDHRTEIKDLRSALDVLRQTPGQLIETDVEVDPAAELSGVYRYVGAGGTVMRPTTVDGPAMIFHNIKGHPGASVAIGVLASRARVADLFGCKKEELAELFRVSRATAYRMAGRGQIPCLRIGELCGLRWENVDMEGRSFKVCETRNRLPNFDDSVETTTSVRTTKTTRRTTPAGRSTLWTRCSRIFRTTKLSRCP